MDTDAHRAGRLGPIGHLTELEVGQQGQADEVRGAGEHFLPVAEKRRSRTIAAIVATTDSSLATGARVPLGATLLSSQARKATRALSGL